MPDPPVLDLGATRADEGFFLIRDHEEREFLPTSAEGTTWRFCGTFRDSAPSLREAVLDLIRNARRKVFVTSFILGDEELIATLASTARRLTGGVYVISELSEQSLSRGLAELAERSEQDRSVSEKVEAEKKRFTSLVSQGIAVRGHENCHAKFLVVDDRVAWVGSANLETRAFTRVGEVGVVFDDERSVATLTRLFARMWKVGCRYELPFFATGYRVVERRDARPVPFAVPEPTAVGTASVVWTDDSAPASLHRNLVDVIARARRELVLASFSLNRMDEDPELLLGPVAKAVARGVRVKMFLRALNHRDRHRRQAGHFYDLGVHLVADDLNHAKAAVADGVHGMLFSANFDADHGLIPGSGIEVGARLDGTPALPELVRYLDHAMECASRLYSPTPTTRQLHDGLAARWQSPWPHGDDLHVRCSDQLRREVVEHLQQGPALWTRKANTSTEIAVGGLRFTLRSGDGATPELVRSGTAERSTTQELAQWMRTASGEGDRGFCPARFRVVVPT